MLKKNQQLTIIHTESHRQWGGQERRVFNECRWMHQKGHRIGVIAPKGSPIYENSLKEGWTVYDVSFSRIRMFTDFFRVRAILSDVKPNVLNTHGNTDAKVALTAAQRLKIPCIIRTRHSTPPVRNSWYNRLLYTRFSHYVFTTASCISHQLIQDLNLPPKRVITLPGCIIPPDELLSEETARHFVCRELNVHSDIKFIGYVGRLSNEKGIDDLIDAFGRVSDHLPNYHLVIVGDGDIMAERIRQVKTLNLSDRVHFTGYRENPWIYFRAFDCHILASRQFEGIPQTVLQAMISGCPVIGTRTGGIPDVISNGDTGLLVPPNDPHSLSQAILTALQDRKESKLRANRALQYALNFHTIDAMGNKILQVYEKVFGF